MKVDLTNQYTAYIKERREIKLEIDFPVDLFIEYMGEDARIASQEDLLNDLKDFIKYEMYIDYNKYSIEDEEDIEINIDDFESVLLPIFKHFIVGDICCVNAPSGSKYCNTCGKKF